MPVTRRRAAAEWSRLPPPHPRRSRWDNNQFRDELEIRLASKTGTLDSLLARYRPQPATRPSSTACSTAALALRRDDDEIGARPFSNSSTIAKSAAAVWRLPTSSAWPK